MLQNEEAQPKRVVLIFLELTEEQALKEFSKEYDHLQTIKIFVSNSDYRIGKIETVSASVSSHNSRALFLMRVGEAVRKRHGIKDSKISKLVSQVESKYYTL